MTTSILDPLILDDLGCLKDCRSLSFAVYSHVLLLASKPTDVTVWRIVYRLGPRLQMESSILPTINLKRNYHLRRCLQTPGFCRRPSFQPTRASSKSGNHCHRRLGIELPVIGNLVLNFAKIASQLLGDLGISLSS
jgi:hypothetical protein